MDQDEIYSIVANIENFQNLQIHTDSFPTKNKLSSAFIFTDNINGIHTEIIVGFDSNFPLTIPNYYIANYNLYEFIPHIERNGKVCYTHEDYVFLDSNRPKQIIVETYALARRTIERGLAGSNRIDFMNEFEAYWSRVEGNEDIWGNIDFVNEPTLINLAYKEKLRIAVSDGKDFSESTSRFVNLSDSGITYCKAIFIPFSIENDEIIPPNYFRNLTFDYIQSLINRLDERNTKILSKIIPKVAKKEEYVLFSFKQPNGINSIFGVKFTKIKSTGHPLSTSNYEGKITPVSIKRIDKEYLFKRGGIGSSASVKKGLIIGGGSIGGFIAEELVRNGFFNITISDGDILSSENCYRHLTGFTGMGENKAAAIKSKIEKYYPHSNVTAINMNIQDALKRRQINFSDYHFIIIATGNVTVNMHLNNIFTSDYAGIPVLYSWNDPYGIGGHCLITNINGKGCYRCIYSNDEFYNMASFAHSKQIKPFLKDLSGCGSMYTPYGSVHTQQTSLLTVKKVIEIMNNEIFENEIHSWKGNAQIFLEEGYSLSNRYNLTEYEMNNMKNNFMQDKCEVCLKK